MINSWTDRDQQASTSIKQMDKCLIGVWHVWADDEMFVQYIHNSCMYLMRLQFTVIVSHSWQLQVFTIKVNFKVKKCVCFSFLAIVSKMARPHIRIIEQPAEKSFRFRYESEGRLSGSLFGERNTAKNVSYPKIEINNFTGKAVVIVSCVTKEKNRADKFLWENQTFISLY